MPPRHTNGKNHNRISNTDKKDTDLIFSVYQDKNTPNPDSLYDDLARFFAKTLDRSGKGDREDGIKGVDR
jgi:hypothetical protein